MADVQSVIAGDEERGGDGAVLYRLASSLGKRIPLYCFEKLLVLGLDRIPTMMVPKGVDQKSFPVYQRYLSMGSLNMSDTIIKAVTDRQKPSGFRLKGDKIEHAADADAMADRCRLKHTIDRTNDDVAKYGVGYVQVASGWGDKLIQYVHPWAASVSEDEDSGCIYQFDEVAGRERLLLYRLVRSDTGEPKSVYARVAYREQDERTLVHPDDIERVQQIGDSYNTGSEIEWNPGNDWLWESDATSRGLEYALSCGHIPLYCHGSQGFVSQISPHIPTICRINQGIFDRMCIQTMQSFRQRAVKGLKNMTYKKNDPPVRAGLKQEGDPVDFDGLFNMGPAALWLLPDGADIWESGVTDFRPFIDAVASDIKHLATSSRTPIDVLSPDVAGSAEGARLKHDNLIAKVTKLNEMAGDMYAQVIRMAMVLDGNKEAVGKQFDMVWLPPEPRDWLSLGQAYSTLKSGLPLRFIWEDVFGMNDQEIARAEQYLQDSSFQLALDSQMNNVANVTDGEQTPTISDQVQQLPRLDMVDVEEGDGE